jgi:hypothetical protein
MLAMVLKCLSKHSWWNKKRRKEMKMGRFFRKNLPFFLDRFLFYRGDAVPELSQAPEDAFGAVTPQVCLPREHLP